MIFTKTEIKDNNVKKVSEYQSIRLLRKADKTSYYVARCLSNRADPTVVNHMCYIKQTITNQDKDKYLAMFNNEVTISKFIEVSINDSGKYFTKLHDSWYESSPFADKFTIVTKYEAFGDLHTFLQFVREQNIHLTEKHVSYILNNILKALHQLHKVNIIHRDIKPDNIFIDQFFQIKLGDFAFSYKAPSRQQARSSQLVGTYGFMSPEYFDPPYSFEVDVWAVGVIHYYMIYQVYPYGLEKNNYQVIVNRRLKGIENENKNSQKFSEYMKNFMKRFFRARDKRQSSKDIYQLQFLHSFRMTEIAIQFKQIYQTFITLYNDQFVDHAEKYILQNHSIYHQKILQVVHYPNWGYFFFLSNLKTLAYFNDKTTKTYPDQCGQANLAFLNTNERRREYSYQKIIEYVDLKHFSLIRQQIRNQNRTLIRKADCGIASLMQCKNTLIIKLKSECQGLKKRELQEKSKAKIITLDQKYQKIPNLSINDNNLDYQNKTIQIFFFQKQQVSQGSQLRYITYKSSLILNNCMLKIIKKRQLAKQFKQTKFGSSVQRIQQPVKRGPFGKRQGSSRSQDMKDQKSESLVSFSKKGINERSKSMRPKTDKYEIRQNQIDNQYQIKQQVTVQKGPSQRMASIKQDDNEPQIFEQNISHVRKEQSNNVEQGRRKNNTNKRRMNIVNMRTKSLNKYGTYEVKSTGRPNIRMPFRKIQFQMKQVKKEDYYWLNNKQQNTQKVHKFITRSLQQQIIVTQIDEQGDHRYQMKKYDNLESIEKQNHKNMINYTKQLFSMMLFKKRQDKSEEPFLENFLINQH